MDVYFTDTGGVKVAILHFGQVFDQTVHPNSCQRVNTRMTLCTTQKVNTVVQLATKTVIIHNVPGFEFDVISVYTAIDILRQLPTPPLVHTSYGAGAVRSGGATETRLYVNLHDKYDSSTRNALTRQLIKFLIGLPTP